jgi:hypothetical protein
LKKSSQSPGGNSLAIKIKIKERIVEMTKSNIGTYIIFFIFVIIYLKLEIKYHKEVELKEVAISFEEDMLKLDLLQ